MATAKVLLRLPASLKARLDEKRKLGFTLNGYVRHLIEQDLNQPSAKAHKKGA